MATYIVVSLQFESWHRWPDAPPQHGYLSYPHRHMFHVRAVKEVTHDEREIEIIQFKRNVLAYCQSKWGDATQKDPSPDSCETMAATLCMNFLLDSCEVLEDGENGAIHHPQIPPPMTTNCELKPQTAEIKLSVPLMDMGISKRRFPKTMFWGTEAEGPHRGMKTLFVPGDVGYPVLDSYVRNLTDLPRYEQRNLYLGADNCYFKPKHLSCWINANKSTLMKKFTAVWLEDFDYEFAEVDKPTLSNLFVVAIATEDEKDVPSYVGFLKEVTNKIRWYLNGAAGWGCLDSWVTELDDKLFTLDKAVGQ